MKEIGLEYYNASDKEKEKTKKKFIEEREQCTEHFLEQNDRESFDALEKIAREAGFEKLLIDPSCYRIHTEIVLGDKYVFYPENCVFNHQKLVEIDKDFARKMAEIAMLHEWEHHSNPSRKANIKRIEEFVKKYKEAEKGNLSEEEDKEETKKQQKRVFLVESQTTLQTIIKNFNGHRDVINLLAGLAVYTRVIYHGLQSLERKISMNGPIHKSFNFLNSETLDKVIKREIEIQKNLIQKYNELTEDQKKEVLLSDKKLMAVDN